VTLDRLDAVLAEGERRGRKPQQSAPAAEAPKADATAAAPAEASTSSTGGTEA
jgi:small subunit ribosomal protein S3